MACITGLSLFKISVSKDEIFIFFGFNRSKKRSSKLGSMVLAFFGISNLAFFLILNFISSPKIEASNIFGFDFRVSRYIFCHQYLLKILYF